MQSNFFLKSALVAILVSLLIIIRQNYETLEFLKEKTLDVRVVYWSVEDPIPIEVQR